MTKKKIRAITRSTPPVEAVNNDVKRVLSEIDKSRGFLMIVTTIAPSKGSTNSGERRRVALAAGGPATYGLAIFPQPATMWYINRGDPAPGGCSGPCRPSRLRTGN